MDKQIMLLGDEALAQAAIDSGISGVYSYPGTPSTEITEYIMNSPEGKSGEVRTGWASNEKTALEAALGMSYAGKRALVCMKHVGLNVAADPFMNSAITGVKGGIIIVSADDPSMHSSQNEQDSRYYGNFAMIPIIEPSNQQEVYEMVRYGYDLSEKVGLPVLLRITTRLAHSRAGVVRREKRKQNDLNIPPKDDRSFILLPAIAKRRYISQLEKQPELEKQAKESGFNKLTIKDAKLGIITTGIAYNYLMENFPDRNIPHSLFKVVQYPIPIDEVMQLYAHSEEILVIEEGYPFIESSLRGMLNLGKKIKGRLDGTLPRIGELNPNVVAKALNMPDTRGADIPKLVAPRPPALCNGCPHVYSYEALNKALAQLPNSRVFADIGCYTLGALPPHNAINTTVDMGASITMAKGASEAGIHPAVAVIGDSTFTHSGITGLVDCVRDNNNVTIMILDNETTAMTGGQDSAATGRIEDICRGVGVDKDHIFVVNPIPRDVDKISEILLKEFEYNGVSVIIPQRECIQTARKKVRQKKD